MGVNEGGGSLFRVGGPREGAGRRASLFRDETPFDEGQCTSMGLSGVSGTFIEPSPSRIAVYLRTSDVQASPTICLIAMLKVLSLDELTNATLGALALNG